MSAMFCTLVTILLVVIQDIQVEAASSLSNRLQPFERTPASQSESVELLTWGRDTIIHRGRKDIHLSTYGPHHSVVVLIVNDVPWTERGLRNLSGEFTIHAPPGQGIMAVVQVLYLRSYKGQSFQDQHCVDYIQFYDPITGLGSSKTCGKLSKDNKSYSPGDVFGARVFSSPPSSGMIQVAYSSDKGDPDFPIDKNYDLSFHMVEIVFTAVTDCHSMSDVSRRRCGLGCISSEVFCDERINCGDEGDFAVDELDCGEHAGIYATTHAHLGRLFIISLYLGAGLSILVLACLTLYHQHTAYRRITNIPHK